MSKIAIISGVNWDWITDLKQSFSDTVGGISDSVKGAIEEALSGLGVAITNAVKESVFAISKWIALGIVDNSLWICLTLAMGGIVFYIAGYKKGARVATVSFIVFILLQLMGSVIR